jgi:hypothetical protein
MQPKPFPESQNHGDWRESKSQRPFFRSLLGALTHLGLARACALSGDTAKAKIAYPDFFALWQDTDPEIPILKKAKAEYAKPQGAHLSRRGGGFVTGFKTLCRTATIPEEDAEPAVALTCQRPPPNMANAEYPRTS